MGVKSSNMRLHFVTFTKFKFPHRPRRWNHLCMNLLTWSLFQFGDEFSLLGIFFFYFILFFSTYYLSCPIFTHGVCLYQGNWPNLGNYIIHSGEWCAQLKHLKGKWVVCKIIELLRLCVCCFHNPFVLKWCLCVHFSCQFRLVVW